MKHVSFHDTIYHLFSAQRSTLRCSSSDPLECDRRKARYHRRTPAARCLRSSDSDSQSIHVSYATGWSAPAIHYALGDDGEWRSALMHRVASAGHNWAHIAVSTGVQSPPLLSFALTDGQGAWDKAPGDANYVIEGIGRYRLVDGEVSEVKTPSMLLVSDLDDTLVGDDEGLSAFAAWWQTHGVPAGGRMVYNTGRALDSFERLLKEQQGRLLVPDVLICSVGTKIYTRMQGTSDQWNEDLSWTSGLHDGWDLSAVREAAYGALALVGNEHMHFRPANEMNEFKVTCGVHVSSLDAATLHMSSVLKDSSVKHRLIVSGAGSWRFVDVVPRAAGKLQATDYVRKQLGFAVENTVACGDSGNDLDMLDGPHKAIIVGNAHPELRSWAESVMSGDDVDAEGRPLVAEAHRAWGILEGLEKLGFREA